MGAPWASKGVSRSVVSLAATSSLKAIVPSSGLDASGRGGGGLGADSEPGPSVDAGAMGTLAAAGVVEGLNGVTGAALILAASASLNASVPSSGLSSLNATVPSSRLGVSGRGGGGIGAGGAPGPSVDAGALGTLASAGAFEDFACAAQSLAASSRLKAIIPSSGFGAAAGTGALVKGVAGTWTMAG